MTPVCMCQHPTPTTVEHPATAHHGATTSTVCSTCGHYYDVRYGSRPAMVDPRTVRDIRESIANMKAGDVSEPLDVAALERIADE
jgi:hypothetical protein